MANVDSEIRRCKERTLKEAMSALISAICAQAIKAGLPKMWSGQSSQRPYCTRSQQLVASANVQHESFRTPS